MKELYIPQTAETYQADVMVRAFPDQHITENDFYRRLIGWVMDVRTPLLYEPTHPDERTNMSINFNWLQLRDYQDTDLGPPDTVATLYSLHEFAHMTHWLPTRLDEITESEYAEQFTGSEYRASNETEILLHYRMPELRALVFPGMRLAVDILKERGLAQPPSQLLNQIRALAVESDVLDHLADDADSQTALARLKTYGGNRAWAAQHYQFIRPRFTDQSLPLGNGLTDADYEQTIANYEPNLTQEAYEVNIVRNVRFAYGMCGLSIPLITNFEQAVAAATELEGLHALVRS